MVRGGPGDVRGSWAGRCVGGLAKRGRGDAGRGRLLRVGLARGRAVRIASGGVVGAGVEWGGLSGLAEDGCRRILNRPASVPLF